jgi:hypothetical protein
LTKSVPSQKEWEVFNKIMQKAEKAETTVQLNYIRALMKKAGLLGKTDDEQWTNWKALLKYLKSTKVDLVKGAKEKGKIKNKKGGVDQNFGTPASSTGVVTPTDHSIASTNEPLDQAAADHLGKYLDKYNDYMDNHPYDSTHVPAADVEVGPKSQQAIDQLQAKVKTLYEPTQPTALPGDLESLSQAV